MRVNYFCLLDGAEMGVNVDVAACWTYCVGRHVRGRLGWDEAACVVKMG